MMQNDLFMFGPLIYLAKTERAWRVGEDISDILSFELKLNLLQKYKQNAFDVSTDFNKIDWVAASAPGILAPLPLCLSIGSFFSFLFFLNTKKTNFLKH